MTLPVAVIVVGFAACGVAAVIAGHEAGALLVVFAGWLTMSALSE